MTRFALLATAGLGTALAFIPRAASAQGHACEVLRSQPTRQAEYRRRCQPRPQPRAQPHPPRPHRQTHQAPRTSAPPPPAAPRITYGTRGITIVSSCSQQFNFRIIFSTSAGLKFPNTAPGTPGFFWTVNPGQTIILGWEDHSPIMSISDEIYFHLSGPNGAFTTSGSLTSSYGGTENLPFRRADVTINSAGNWNIHFC